MEKKNFANREIWLVYDGECPVCATYCNYTRLKEAAGKLILVDARHPSPLLDEVTALGLDIDQGMVVKIDGQIYYGPDAIHMLALLTNPSDFFNRLNVWIYGTKLGAKIAYPFGKAMRNLALKAKGVKHIDNLGQAARAKEAK